MSKFFNQIKDARLRAGIKAKDLAEALGVSSSYLSQVENGVRPASESLLSKVAEITGDTLKNLSTADSPQVDTSPTSSMLSSLEARLGEVERKLGTIESLLLQIIDRLKIKDEL